MSKSKSPFGKGSWTAHEKKLARMAKKVTKHDQVHIDNLKRTKGRSL